MITVDITIVATAVKKEYKVSFHATGSISVKITITEENLAEGTEVKSETVEKSFVIDKLDQTLAEASVKAYGLRRMIHAI